MPESMLTASERGRGYQRSRISRALAQAIRDDAPPELLRDYWLARMQGFHNVRLARDEETGDYYVTYTDPDDLAPGTPPVPQDEIDKAAQWLSDRGYGLPAQNIQLDANIRQHSTSVTAHLPIGELPPAALAMMRSALAMASGNTGALPPGAPASTGDPSGLGHVIEAHGEERGVGEEVEPGAPASTGDARAT